MNSKESLNDLIFKSNDSFIIDNYLDLDLLIKVDMDKSFKWKNNGVVNTFGKFFNGKIKEDNKQIFLFDTINNYKVTSYISLEKKYDKNQDPFIRVHFFDDFKDIYLLIDNKKSEIIPKEISFENFKSIFLFFREIDILINKAIRKKAMPGLEEII